MASLNSVFKRLNLAVSGLSNAFFGQTPTQARLNVIESYDLSNELFKVLYCSLPGVRDIPRYLELISNYC
jgi:hypothetical protein